MWVVDLRLGPRWGLRRMRYLQPGHSLRRRPFQMDVLKTSIQTRSIGNGIDRNKATINVTSITDGAQTGVFSKGCAQRIQYKLMTTIGGQGLLLSTLKYLCSKRKVSTLLLCNHFRP